MQITLQCTDAAGPRRNAAPQTRSRPRVLSQGFKASEGAWGWQTSQAAHPCRHCILVEASRDYTRAGAIQPQQAIAGAGLPGPLATPGPLPSQLANSIGNKTVADEALLSLKRYNTQRIKLCSDWRQLAKVVAVHGHVFNTINTCAALVHLAQLGHGPQQPYLARTTKGEGSTTTAIDDYAAYEALLQRLLQMACSEIPKLQARQVANVMWAAATLSGGYTGGHPLCRDLLHQLLPVSAAMLPWNNAQELTNSIWAVATAGLNPDDQWLLEFLNSTQTSLPQTSGRDLATMLWALRTLGVSPDDEWLGAYAARLRQVAMGAATAQRDGAAARVRSRADAPLTHRDTAQVLAAMGHLGVDLAVIDGELLEVLRDRLLEDWGTPAGDQLGSVDGSRWCVSMSQGLWALVRMSATPPADWTQKVMGLMESRLDQFGPKELSTCLWAIVSLGQPLSPSLLRAVYAATLITSPWTPALAVSMNQEESEHMQQLLPEFCPQSLAELIWAVAAADQAHAYQTGTTSRPLAPPSAWTRAFLHAVSSRLPQGGFTEQPTAMVLVSLARLGITPPPAWASAMISHVNTALGDVRPQALTNCMWALATMGFHVNQEGLQALEAQLQSLLQPVGASGWDAAEEHADSWQSSSPGADGWGSQELSNTLWVLAKWRHRPADEVTELLMGRLRVLCRTEGAGFVKPQELTNALWALGQLGVQPSDAWLHDVWGACARLLRVFGPQDVAQLVHALAKLGRRPPPPCPEQENEVVDCFHANLLAPGMSPAAHPASTSTTITASAGDATPPAARPPPPEWVTALLPAAASVLARSTGQDLSNLAWGLAQLGVRPGQGWCERLARELMTRGSTFSGSHLALCVWALGRMGYKPAAQSLLPLERLLFRRMPSLAPRELAACCSGFASMSYRPDLEWLEGYAAQCKVLAHEFTQHEWSTVLWSLARIVDLDKEAGVYLEDLFLSPQLAARMDEFGASGVAILTYACGVLGSRSPRLMGRLLTAAITRMSQFSGQELAALITSCAGTGVVPDRAFFQAWAHEVALRMQADGPSGPAVAPGAVRPRAQGFGSPLGAAAAVAVPPVLSAVDVDGTTEPMPEDNQCGLEATSMLDAINSEGVQGVEAAGRSDEPPSGMVLGMRSRSPVLTPTMLAVSGWALAKLGFRPKVDWLQLYSSTLQRYGRAGGLGPRETHMIALALAAWERQVPYELVRMLRLLAKQHKPLYSKAERWSINLALKVLRTISTAPPHLVAQQQQGKQAKQMPHDE